MYANGGLVLHFKGCNRPVYTEDTDQDRLVVYPHGQGRKSVEKGNNVVRVCAAVVKVPWHQTVCWTLAGTSCFPLFIPPFVPVDAAPPSPIVPLSISQASPSLADDEAAPLA